jgi:hypothetical protein
MTKGIGISVRASVFLSVLLAGIALAACGGSEEPPREPKIPAGLAQDLAAQADAVAATLEAGDPCGAKEQALALQADVAEAINTGRIPRAFQRELRSVVAELVQIECVAEEPPPEEPVSCEPLEERKAQLEAEKEEIKEIEDEEERKAREAEIEAEKKAVEEELKACEEDAKGDEGEG